MTTIRNQFTNQVICSGKDVRDAVESALAAGIYLSGASLYGVDLEGVNFGGAIAREANFNESNLSGSRFRGTNLEGASFEWANISGASFEGANISGSNFKGANISGVDLRRADLSRIQADFNEVLAASPKEGDGLRLALVEGRIDGSAYTGECCCLIGTLANLAGCKVTKRPGLVPDVGRPSECWFLAIKKGDTPETSQFVAIAVEWLDQWKEWQ